MRLYKLYTYNVLYKLYTYNVYIYVCLLQIRERIHDLKAEVQHLNEVWEQHRAFLAAIYEYQVFLKEEKMVDGTSSAHEVKWEGNG